MCFPIAALGFTAMQTAMAGLSIGSTLMSANAANQQASMAQQAAANDYSYQMELMRLQQEQINKASANDAGERAKQGMIERGTMMVAAGESGALGLSSDRVLSDSLFQEGTDIASIEANRQSRLQGTSAEANSIRAKTQSAINQAESKKPTLLGTGLQIAGDIYNIKATPGLRAKP